MNDNNDDLAILKTSSLTSALEKQLERLIADGELAPGERLNEIHLSNRFGTSRGPLREATRSLEAKGFVEVIRNRGVFVRQLNIEEVLEIYDIRGALFGLAGRLVAQKMTDDMLGRLTRQIRDMEAAAAAGDFDTYYPLNLQFHRSIVEASGNKALIDEYSRLVKKMHLFRTKSLVQGGGLAVSNCEHNEMLNALASGDAERAHATHWRHVERAKYRMLAAIEDEKLAVPVTPKVAET
ncbi:MAG TPA: FCD domain-containing protein [Aurantimonas coralicida]|uniref:FCD domain-containing protein n=2 Tax=root TaxID=1 RepID=A0A9C9NDF6_9HYPH|nr:FCD domain-containing protein [Aurantimonas coralicida]HET99857.1 FCD domain-containing protein [Aurantimonas coralicida]